MNWNQYGDDTPDGTALAPTMALPIIAIIAIALWFIVYAIAYAVVWALGYATW